MFRRKQRPQHTPDRRAPVDPRPPDPAGGGGAGAEPGAEPAPAGEAEGGAPAPPPPERPRQWRSTPELRAKLLAQFAASDLDAAAFAALHGMRPSTLETWLRQARRAEARPAAGPARRRTFTPEERRAAIEAFAKSGRKREDFAKLWGCSPSSLDKWIRRYEEEGPKGLEDRPYARRADRPSRRRIPDSARAQVVAVRQEHPDFGSKRIADHLARFHGLSISPSSVRSILCEAGVSPQAVPPKKPRRKPKPPRRFERAKPGELWQSDITSYVLRRQGRRVYFTVFLDDHSRFILAWALATHQRTPLVTEPLLEAIARFGKPREVLTDQGRQYYAWRGKSGFQKLLAKEGIQHVVSRAHHPETLGKCERLWKTVADEFWDRAAPQDLDDARQRIAHWVRHYNFFRPHQGIDGLVPADRFFGAESALRETLEKEVAANALRLALDEAPRKPVYLVGQIGEERISLHGERGRLVVDTPDGGRRELDMEELGLPQHDKEEIDARGPETPGDGRESRVCAQAQKTHRPQADGLPAPGAGGLAGAGTVGGGAGEAEAGGPPDLHGDFGVLAGEEIQGRGRGGSRRDAAARVATEPAGSLGDAGGPARPAQAAGGPGDLRGAAGPVPGGAAAQDRGPGAEAVPHRGFGASAAHGAVGQSGQRGRPKSGGEAWTEAQSEDDEEARQGGTPAASEGGKSEPSSEPRATPRRLWKRWLRRRGSR